MYYIVLYFILYIDLHRLIKISIDSIDIDSRPISG